MLRLAPVLTLLAVLAAAPAASAASFDCRKASTAVEKKICADPALSKADEALAAAWRAALAETPTPASLRREQRRWLREASTETDLPTAWRARTGHLQAVAAASRALRAPLSTPSLRTRCVPVLQGRACRVADVGVVRFAGAEWLWQTQEVQGEGFRLGTPVVMLRPQPGGRAAPVLWRAEEGAHFAPPEAVQGPGGPLLKVEGHYDGTGNFNAGAVFRAEAGRLVEIDADSWTDQLPRRLPKGLGAWKGIYIDYATFTASTPLWRSDDGNCCPTGGRADLSFRMKGDAIELDRVKVTRGRKAAEGG